MENPMEDPMNNPIRLTESFFFLARRGRSIITNSGAAFIFRQRDDEWTEESKLFAAEGQSGDRLGSAVATSDGLAAVGAPGDDSAGRADAVSVVLFVTEAASWNELMPVLPTNSQAEAEFGASLDLEAEVLVVGAPGDATFGENAGGVFVFRRLEGGDWTQEAKLTPDDLVEGARFGTAMSLAHPYLLVGAPDATGSAPNAGAAYVYRHDGNDWIEERKLFLVDGNSSDSFGQAVDLLGDIALVGSPSIASTDADHRSGLHAFLRQGEEWLELFQSDSPSPEFGSAVSLSAEGFALVGIPRNPDPRVEEGAVHVFKVTSIPDCDDSGTADICEVPDRVDPDCNNNGILDACDLADGGISDDANGNGRPDECENFVRGDVTQDGRLSAADYVALYYSPFFFGDSILCWDTTDVDDDGLFARASDLDILSCFFIGENTGCEFPADPFPDAGVDITVDGFTFCDHSFNLRSEVMESDHEVVLGRLRARPGDEVSIPILMRTGPEIHRTTLGQDLVDLGGLQLVFELTPHFIPAAVEVVESPYSNQRPHSWVAIHGDAGVTVAWFMCHLVGSACFCPSNEDFVIAYLTGTVSSSAPMGTMIPLVAVGDRRSGGLGPLNLSTQFHDRGHRHPFFETQSISVQSGEISIDELFVRGDLDGSGIVDLTDAIRSLSFLFLGSFEVKCLDAADADDNGVVELTDALGTLAFLFLSADLFPGLPAGLAKSERDLTEDALAECRGLVCAP
jgi:hypothetical protein